MIVQINTVWHAPAWSSRITYRWVRMSPPAYGSRIVCVWSRWVR